VPGDASRVGRPTKDTPYWEVDIDSGYGSEKYRALHLAVVVVRMQTTWRTVDG
jgi:hypothetical protein